MKKTRDCIIIAKKNKHKNNGSSTQPACYSKRALLYKKAIYKITWRIQRRKKKQSHYQWKESVGSQSHLLKGWILFHCPTSLPNQGRVPKYCCHFIPVAINCNKNVAQILIGRLRYLHFCQKLPSSDLFIFLSGEHNSTHTQRWSHKQPQWYIRISFVQAPPSKCYYFPLKPQNPHKIEASVKKYLHASDFCLAARLFGSPRKDCNLNIFFCFIFLIPDNHCFFMPFHT